MIERSPVPRQLLGLAVTLTAVCAFSAYALYQIQGLRTLQSEILDRNRRDTLQLLRIQNDLNQLGLALRDMAEGVEPYPITAYRQQMERLRIDLEDALLIESRIAIPERRPDQQQMLHGASQRFWEAVGELWNLAGAGREEEAKAMIRTRLESERTAMTSIIARLLVQNNEAEAAAANEIQSIYGRVERNIYWMLAAVLVAIGLTGFLVIRNNRQLFEHVYRLSEERKELAGQLIKVQEESYRSLAREIHDEFGQVLTAVGAMLARVQKKVPTEAVSLRADIHEVREIAQHTLERARTLSQMLHPPVLDDYGLEQSVEWYLRQFEKQTAMKVNYSKTGGGIWIGDPVSVHVYRILQEALTNVVKHAGVNEVWVTAQYGPESLILVVEDRGAGIRPSAGHGIGLIGMRERAELLRGAIEFVTPDAGGTRVVVRVPLEVGDGNGPTNHGSSGR